MTDEKIRYTALLRTLIFVFKDDRLLMMKYSGKGTNQSKEKSDRKDIYNPIGGHIEAGEDVIAGAEKEAMEEAGITLLHPTVKGIINVSGFAGKNMVNFIVVAGTKDEPLKKTLEGELHWISMDSVGELNVFADIRPILDKLQALRPEQLFVGTAQFEGFTLTDLRLRTI